MIQLAATSGISLREYAATLTALIQANGRAASAQVGDGAGVVGAVAGWMLTSEPQRGEHANETWFITQEGAIYRGRVSAEIIGVQRVMVGAEGMMGLTLKQPGNVPDAPYFDGAFPGWRATTAGEKRRADAEHCCSATRCDYSPTTTSPCSRQLFCTRRRRPKTNHKKTVPITERRLNIQPGQRHEAHHIPDGQNVLLGVRIAPGGEGSVHEVSGNQDIVAIYHQGRRPPEIAEKLRQMVSRPPGGNAPDGVAWPWARFVADRDGQTHGYLMQRAKPGAMPAAVFRSCKLRKAAPGNQPEKPTGNPSTDGRDSRQVRCHNAEDARLRIRRRRRQRHALSHLDLDPTKLIASNKLLPRIRRQPPGCRLEQDGKASIAGPTTGC